ncbi:hypothetical protein MASR1M59_02430 [Melaminivora sp.]
MSRLIVTIDGVVIKEVPLTKERTTVGRRPYNDIVIDHLAVSGEHAVFLLQPDGSVEAEDMGSTNGTAVNGHAIKHQALHNGDTVEVGKYKLRFMADPPAPEYEKTVFMRPGTPPHMTPPVSQPVLNATVRVASGPAAGREVALAKVVTTLGKPGVAVASITRRPHGYVLAHVEGESVPTLNGIPLGPGATPLHHGDKIGLAGTEMEFLQS